MEDLFSDLAGATHYSQIDLSSAYHQLPLHPESRKLTAFITHEGLFQFTRVPFGLASAPSAFQKMMQTVLKDLPGVRNYLDDIIVYGTSKEVHDTRLQAVLQRLRDVGLQINAGKSSFCQSHITFLGHVISKEGLRPSQHHLTAIAEAPAPKDMAALRSFLGLSSWFSKFIPDYATLVEPLRQLLKTDMKVELQWNEAAHESFSNLKKLLLESPALAVYDPDLPAFITTDASDYGLGAVLTQLHPDQVERVVAFASRTLSPAERKYSTTEKEALACVWAVERWRTYVWGRRFTLRTDHQALTTLLSTKGMNRAGMRIARWSARLMCFQYDVQYRPGVQNVIADCLSRVPLTYSSTDIDAEKDLLLEIAEVSPLLTATPLTDFKAECEDCPDLSLLRQVIRSGWPKVKRSLPPEIQPYFLVRHELAVESPLVFRGTRLVVPRSLREKVICLAHEGHQGIVRTKQRLRELYWWPCMDTQVHAILSSCSVCQLCDKTAKTAPTPLQPVQFPDGPFQHVAVDIVGPFDRGSQDCRFAITLVDYFSKWPEVAFTSSATTDTVIRFLSSVFAREGNPCELTTDNGPQFTSSAFADFLKERGIKHIRTSVYHPQANGCVERFNRVLKDCVQAAQVSQKLWKPAVTEMLQNYRATAHATTDEVENNARETPKRPSVPNRPRQLPAWTKDYVMK
ncbi:uncharacterized protein K02A2.6-like [Haplochromis burtoni]|uniref:uncharacterized protein K02A2.6-like n=1 Tax=Haplochromis burtoni TaxID=8153 RepID=UPI001C2D7078|nr:uncharacterized protein K02A2.6-like [Haplochromis burtoni]